ncbi:MarR family winged helix-turn-helix transcriptional regulator [Gluconobacter japonicus]|uniref:MarR family winged helix-turn-helix transcriptional regulator n=1 Tax=Gluconobacter japonicus TaxID=376620 RepID=UPI003D28B1DA
MLEITKPIAKATTNAALVIVTTVILDVSANPATTVCEATMISSGGMVNWIGPLERSGLVERRPNPKDGRDTLVGLTDKRLATIDQAVEVYVKTYHHVVSGLNEEERRNISHILKKFIIKLIRIKFLL